MTENTESSYYYSYDEYSYDDGSGSDYSYYSDEDEIDKQIKYYKDAIMDLKLARDKDNALLQAQQIIQQQKANSQNSGIESPAQSQNQVTQHTQDIVEITKAAIKTAIESQAQVLASQLPQSRFIQHQVEQPLLGDTQSIQQQSEQDFQTELQQQPPQQQNIDQQQEQSVVQHDYKASQLEDTGKLYDQQQEQVKQLTYQHQKQLQKLQEDNEKHKRDAENYAAKVDDREDIIKNLTKLLKKKDPNFNIANVLQNKQLIEQMVKMQQQDSPVENYQNPTHYSENTNKHNTNQQQQYQPPQHNFHQQNMQQYTQPQQDDESQKYRQITRSSIDLNDDDGVPFSPKRVPKGRLNPMSPSASMNGQFYQDDNKLGQAGQIKQQQNKSSINFNYAEDNKNDDVGVVKSRTFGTGRNVQQQKVDTRTSQPMNQQNYRQEDQWQQNKPNYNKNNEGQQNYIDDREFTRVKEENDNNLLRNTTKQRQTNFQLNWNPDDDDKNSKQTNHRRNLRKSRNMEPEDQYQYQQEQQQQPCEYNPPNQQSDFSTQENNAEPAKDNQNQVMSFDDFLRERARYAAMKELEAQKQQADTAQQQQNYAQNNQESQQTQQNQYDQQNYQNQQNQQQEHPVQSQYSQQPQQQAQQPHQLPQSANQAQESMQRELEELRRFKEMVQSQQQQKQAPALSNIYLNHRSRDNTEESKAMLQAMPNYMADALEIRQRHEQTLLQKQAESASQIEQNKRYNQQSTQIMRNLNPIDTNNPRYQMYRNVDNQYSAIQIQLQEHRNDLNRLYSHKITRKEQLRINFLEQRVRELENDAGKLRAQLKIFEQEFA